MSDIESLKRQRSAFKGQLTQFKNKLTSLSTVGAIESNVRRLQIVYDKYHQVQSKLELQDETTAVDRGIFEEDYEFVESTLFDKLHDIKKLENQPKEAINFETSANSTQIEQSIPSMSIKLPELKLPNFSGAENEWLAFRDVFLDLIHNKSSIDSTVKFVYLKTHIRSGKAFHLIEHLPVTSDNYEIAWKALCDRYDNATLIQKAHMRDLYNVKVPSENSSSSLQGYIDHTVKHYNVLKSLHVQVGYWDLMLIHHLVERLDNSSKVYIIKNSEVSKLLTFEKFIALLRNRVRVLEAIKGAGSNLNPSINTKRFNQFKGKSTSLVSNSLTCPFCGGEHMLPNCSAFADTKITPQMRFQFVRTNQLCTNCLILKHSVGMCDRTPCGVCSLKHNTLLHFNSSNYKRSKFNSGNSFSLKKPNNSVPPNQTVSNIVETVGFSSSNLKTKSIRQSSCSTENEQILIGTALVKATSESNNQLLCRALLDSGSHLNFITEHFANLIKVRKQPTNKTISGIGGKESTIKTKACLTISSRISNFSATLEFFIIPKITNELPTSPVNAKFQLLPVNIELADPYFYIPDRIDILLGAEIYNQLFTNSNSVSVLKNLPPFYASVFGYVVSGKVKSSYSVQECTPTSLCSIETLNNNIKQFWELETVSNKTNYSLDEKICEELYNKTYKRVSTGRYSVSLPINDNINQLGFSNYTSLMQFYAMERRLIRQQDTYKQYRDFMDEYLSLDHMVLVQDPGIITNPHNKAYYLPHHFVRKDTSTTTQLRVVFNGSAKTSSKLSLNDCLLKGPIVQQDLLSIILRFRKHLIAFTADIAKMYRQILIDESQQDFQRIWWRNNPSETVKCFKLRTVTYGTKSAPYLATRTLQQLALDESISFPLASQTLMQDFYVDDVLTGADTIENALKLKIDLTNLLKKGKFELRKFASNIHEISSHSESSPNVSLVLGLSWNTSQDTFVMNFSKFSLETACTKRNVLSEICQLFDPLGLCSPMILIAKFIMQTIWTLHNVDWDDYITQQVCDQWIEFKKQLIELKQIIVPRCILVPQSKLTQIHGFSDASEKGFGCVIYLRITDQNNKTYVRLICSKSRVAPLKKQTIPRLELCAALLLAQTLNKLLESLTMPFNDIFLWSDSEITLLRIKSEPAKFATFVANRLTQIQELTSVNSWCYVPTSENPADFVSRGIMPSEFANQNLWWSGPSFLLENQSKWPKNSNMKISCELQNLDLRKVTSTIVCNSALGLDDFVLNLFERYSSFTKLLRVTAYILRYKNNIQPKRHAKISGELNSNELAQSLTFLVKIIQHMEYDNEIQTIKRGSAVQNSSNLKLLSPFIDEMGILRVGGRLRNSNLNSPNKHPILLPSKHKFTKLLVQLEHKRLLHCGAQTLLYNIRSQYWIIGGRNLCRQAVNQCVICFRSKPKLVHEVMGDLPEDRVTQSRPFSIVGIDFCGPFFVKPNTKSKTKIKIYVCLFICFAVKAIHLEMVMDLSSESFLACLRRFVARRGYCTKIYSDNATNFIGCRSELNELRRLFISENFQNDAKIFCSHNKIEWLTIPPRSPHFGGLWESAIKNAKWHMKRVVGLRCLTLEEHSTLICQIEACLNSRPLTAISTDPTDLNALSPGHFLVGGPLLALPEPSLLDLNINRLSRYQLIQIMLQDFWKRWHVEYLNELQKRYKWQKSSNNTYKIGTLVLLHEDNAPPIAWNLGRIIETHPGSDNRIRVVTIKTAKSIVKRSIAKISVLPIES